MVRQPLPFVQVQVSAELIRPSHNFQLLQLNDCTVTIIHALRRCECEES